jgi:hypothetical protein
MCAFLDSLDLINLMRLDLEYKLHRFIFQLDSFMFKNAVLNLIQLVIVCETDIDLTKFK